MNDFLFVIKEYWAILGIVVVFIGTVIREYIKWKGAKSDETLRYEYQKSFDKIISDLSSENTSLQLTAAILLRRFFMINEMKKCGDFLKDETIHVISSLLRTLPSSVFQKTVGDGLAYAKDLSGVDLQRTNLQDICLEGKSSRLILNNCDLFMADLSYALVKNIDAEGAYFYHSILLKTRFKNCNLKGADFRNADLTKTCFENVDLFTAKFDGAINIPEEISAGLDDYIDTDGNVYKAYMKEQKVTISQNSSSCNIFFSIPGCTSAEDNALISEYRKKLEDMNYNVVCYTRDQYPQFGQLNKVRKDILQSAAMLVFGFKQIRIDKAIFRPNTKEEEVWEKKWLPTPWNEIEVGLGAMLGLPILLVKDNDIHSGIFDNHLSESFIAVVSANDKIDDVFKGRSFNLWLSKFKNADISNDVIKEDFVNNYAERLHEICCEERLNQGWTYGATRNDELKQHPCLVKYELLVDSEKEHNRNAAITTYNAISQSGFRIYKK